MALSWRTPIRLTGVPDNVNNDVYGMVENHMCVLDSGIVIAGGLSSDSYAIHYWAIDLSGDTPVVGPDCYFNSNGNSWASLTDDPALDAVNDMNEIVALGDYRFGMTGEASQSYNAGGAVDNTVTGTYGHVASLYTVDPVTLVITRDHLVVGNWGSSSPYLNQAVQSEATVARWGDTMVITRDRSNSPNNYIWLVESNGTLTIINVSASSWNELSTPVVIGNSAFLFAQDLSYTDYHLLEVALPGGSITDHGAQSAISDANWTWFGTPTGGGTGAAWVVSADNSGNAGTVKVATWDGTTFTVTDLSATGQYVGFTGGWYSNVRDIHVMTHGSVLVSYIEGTSRQFTYKLIFQGAPFETGQIADFYEPPFPTGYNYAFSARTGALPDGRAVALWASHTYNGGGTNYGLYFAYTGIPPFWRNLVINPSGEQSFDRAWFASNGAVATKVEWVV